MPQKRIPFIVLLIVGICAAGCATSSSQFKHNEELQAEVTGLYSQLETILGAVIADDRPLSAEEVEQLLVMRERARSLYNTALDSSESARGVSHALLLLLDHLLESLR